MRIEVDFDNLPDALARGGFLDPLRADDPGAVCAAVERMLANLTAAHFGDV